MPGFTEPDVAGAGVARQSPKRRLVQIGTPRSDARSFFRSRHNLLTAAPSSGVYFIQRTFMAALTQIKLHEHDSKRTPPPSQFRRRIAANIAKLPGKGCPLFPQKAEIS
jgi:hypothetical protein